VHISSFIEDDILDIEVDILDIEDIFLKLDIQQQGKLYL